MVGRYPAIQLIGGRPLPKRQVPKDPRLLTPVPGGTVVSSRITSPFGELFAS